MKKTTKGALAAGAAAVLLLGGAGSLAFWTDSGSVSGGTITTGEMSISNPDCGDGWTLDSGEATAGAAFDPTADLLVPGDVITETCTTTFTGTGEHLRATLTADPGANSTGLFSGDPAMLTLGVGALQSSADGTNWVDVPATGLTEANNGEQVRLTLTVTFDSTADNTTQNVASTLDAITITATQVHS